MPILSCHWVSLMHTMDDFPIYDEYAIPCAWQVLIPQTISKCVSGVANTARMPQIYQQPLICLNDEMPSAGHDVFQNIKQDTKIPKSAGDAMGFAAPEHDSIRLGNYKTP